MVKKGSNEDSKIWAFLGVFLHLIGFIIVFATKKDDKYAMFYAKQGLVLFIVWVIAWFVNMFLGWLPFIGAIIGYLVWLGVFALWVIGIIYSLSGEMKEIPLIGQFAKQINL